jgi:hypothetical protein
MLMILDLLSDNKSIIFCFKEIVVLVVDEVIDGTLASSTSPTAIILL